MAVDVVDPVAGVDAVDHRPPRALVVRAGPVDGGGDIGGQVGQFGRVDDAAEMEKAGPSQEVGHLGVGVVEGEGAVEIEGLAGLVQHRRRVLEVVDGLPVEGDPQ